MSKFNRVLQNFKSSKFILVLVLDILSKGLDYLLLPFYLFLMPPKEYGLYTYTIFVLISVSNLIKLGQDTAFNKLFFDKNKYRLGSIIFNTSLIWVTLLIFTIFILFLTDFIFLKSIGITSNVQFYSFFLLYVFYNLIQNTIYTYSILVEKPIRYQIFNVVRSVIVNGLSLFLMKYFIFESQSLLRIQLESILGLVAIAPLVWGYLKHVEFGIEFEIIKESFRIGLPMVGVLMVSLIYTLSDKFFIQKNGGFEQLAVYNLAILLTTPISLIITSFQTVWFPKFATNSLSDNIFKKTNKYVIVLFITFVSIFILIFIILKILFYYKFIQNRYSGIFAFFFILFFAKISENLTHLYNNFIVLWGKTTFNLIISIFFGITTLILSYYFIPNGGAMMAALVLFSMSNLRLFAYYIFVKNRIKNL